MKTTVTYFSQTGNTRKVAEAIAGALPGDVTLAELASGPDTEDADVVFVGMPVVRFGPPPEVTDYLRRHCAGRDVALFVTHAAPEGMPELEPWLAACREAATGARIVGFFDCQGQLAEPVRRWMEDSGMPDMVAFAAMADVAAGQPDASRLAAARAFAADTAARVTAGVATAV
jgi:hypothetical protein